MRPRSCRWGPCGYSTVVMGGAGGANHPCDIVAHPLQVVQTMNPVRPRRCW